jgi:pyruvate kinase
MLRRTKIVCTLGPACDSLEVLRKMIRVGMNVARLNVSHGTRDSHRALIRKVKEAALRENKVVGIMLDMKGPELRVGKFKNGKVKLQEGGIVRITRDNVLGSEGLIPLNYEFLSHDLKKGDTVLLDDGLINLEVIKSEFDEVICKVVNGGVLSDHKGVNLPGLDLSLPSLTESDYEDIIMGIEEGVHFIAVSFVRKAQDVLDIREFIEDQGANNIQLISKVETQAAVKNFADILQVVDAVMIARGDLGVEILPEEVPLVQKKLINQCNQAGKPVITATHMLDSMVRNPRPTRAEASDVANAIFDGTDAIMLSGETAVGKFPVEAVKTMDRIAVRTEEALNYQDMLQMKLMEFPKTITDAISHASCTIAMDLQADAILTPTVSGFTARMVSRYRPKPPIVGLSAFEDTLAHLCLTWGVIPVKVQQAEVTDEMIQKGIEVCQDKGLIRKGDLVVITAGVPVSGTTNLLKVVVVK